MQAYNTGFSGESKVQGLPGLYSGFKANLGNLVRLCHKLSKRVSMETVVKMHVLGSRFRSTAQETTTVMSAKGPVLSTGDHKVLRCIHSHIIYIVTDCAGN